jgi:hypothetical protein
MEKRRVDIKSLPADDLEQIALRDIRDAADKIREASNAVKRIGEMTSEHAAVEEAQRINERMKVIKREAGRRKI